MKKRHYNTEKILLDSAKIVGSTLELDKVVGLILRESTKALEADSAALFLMDDETGHLTLTGAHGFTKNEKSNISLLRGWELINDRVEALRKPVIFNNVRHNAPSAGFGQPFLYETIAIRSFLAVPLLKHSTCVGTLIVSNRQDSNHVFTAEDADLLKALSHYVAIALLNAKLYKDKNDLFISTVKALVRAVEAKDPYTSGHSERVMMYALALGRELKLDSVTLENLRLAAILHDVGKIGIRENVLLKPRELTKHQREIIQQHPAIGKEIVSMVKNADTIVQGVYEHHERFDGKGYPQGLKGSHISQQGRIIALADVYDALTTSRPYKKKYTAKEAFLLIVEDSKTHFDPRVIKAFMISFSRYPSVWHAQLSR